MEKEKPVKPPWWPEASKPKNSASKSSIGTNTEPSQTADYDTDLIAQVFKCRMCDFEAEGAAAAMIPSHLKKHTNAEKLAAKQKISGQAAATCTKAKVQEVTRQKWIREFNTGIDDPYKFISATEVRCQKCETNFNVTWKSNLKKHHDSDKHQKGMQLKAKRKSLQLQGGGDVEEKKPRVNKLAHDLCRAWLAANIPFHKLDHPILRKFLEEYISLGMPSVRTVVRNVDVCYEEVMQVCRNFSIPPNC